MGLQVAVTEAAQPWVDRSALDVATQATVRSEHRSPDAPKDRARPDVVVVCPATFNTVGKLATGIADTYVASVLAEHLGAGVPMIVVPMVKEELWGHPAWEGHLATLTAAGVTLLDPQSLTMPAGPVRSGTGEQVTAGFDVAGLVARVVETS